MVSNEGIHRFVRMALISGLIWGLGGGLGAALCARWGLGLSFGLLDYAAERIFLRKVGGGSIFIHRLFQEYFAARFTGPRWCGHPGACGAAFVGAS